MKYILTESQFKKIFNTNLLSEQIPDTRYMSSVEKKAHNTHGLGRRLTHNEMTALGILAALGGPIGLGVSTLFNVMNSVSYASEGNQRDSGLELIFAALPALPVAKVIGVAGKNNEFMKSLAGKILKKQKLNADEAAIVKNIQKNSPTIISNIQNNIKNAAKTVSTSPSLNNNVKTILAKVATGAITLGKELASHMAIITGYDLAFDNINKTNTNKA